MRKLLFFIGILSLNFCFAQTTTFLFLDKSTSVSFGKNTKQVEKALVESIGNCKKESDRLLSFYIHKNTAGAGVDLSVKAKKFTCSGCSGLELKQKKEEYNRQLRSECVNFAKNCRSVLISQGTTAAASGTDIFGILNVLSRTILPGQKNLVYLFSDMIHDFDGKKVNPKSLSEAKQQAVADLTFVRNKLSFDPNKLRGIMIKYILPSDPSDSDHNQYLDVYWEEFFTRLGMTVERFN